MMVQPIRDNTGSPDNSTHPLNDNNDSLLQNYFLNPFSIYYSSPLFEQSTQPTDDPRPSFPPNSNLFNTPSPMTQPTFYNIGTLNIRQGFNNKLNDILSVFISKKFAILCLNETGQHNFLPTNDWTRVQKLVKEVRVDSDTTTHHTKLFLYHNNLGTSKGSGTSIIIDQKTQNHVFNHKSYAGRIQYLDLSFSKRKPIRLINIYLPPDSPDNKQQFIDTLEKLKELFIDSKSKSYQIILLGDFNVKIEEYYLKYGHLSSIPPNRFKVYDSIFKANLIDVQKHFYTQPGLMLMVTRHVLTPFSFLNQL